VTGPSDQMVAAVLPPAIEVMTAFTQSGDDPGFYWHAVQRVLTDGAAGGDTARATAELTFGLSALAGILLEDLARTTGRAPTEILSDLHRHYVSGRPDRRPE
jgi:hypothetical protein